MIVQAQCVAHIWFFDIFAKFMERKEETVHFLLQKLYNVQTFEKRVENGEISENEAGIQSGRLAVDTN